MAPPPHIARANGRKGGRPKGSKSNPLAKAEAREIARQLITERLRPLIEAQIANASGIKYLVVRDKQGKFQRVARGEAERLNPDESIVEVWEKDPSVQAFSDLMNRAIDKPKEQEQEIQVDARLEIKWQS